jgi:hypothetical protein
VVGVLAEHAGDVLIAVVNRTAGTSAGEYPASIDQTASQVRSWVGIYSGNPGDPPTLPATSSWGIIDSFGFPGNWMIRGYGNTGVAGGWASAVPDSGTVPASSTATFEVVFDARTITETGTYSAELSFSGTFVNEVPVMPLTMHLGAPNAEIGLEVTLSTDGSCGTTDTLTVPEGTTVYYCYTVTNLGNMMMPNHTISDTVFGLIDTFAYDLWPGMSESVIYPQVVSADVTSTATWMAENPDYAVTASATDTATVTMEEYMILLPVIDKP